jgi:hypothetical protein
MGAKKLWAGIPVALAGAAMAAPAFGVPAATCSPRVLASSPKSTLHVVSLDAGGMSCVRAATIVAPLIKDVADGKGISVSGAAGVSMTQTIANSLTTTHVKLSFENGSQISLALEGRVKGVPGDGAFPSFPVFPGFPNLPAPGPSGASNGTVV